MRAQRAVVLAAVAVVGTAWGAVTASAQVPRTLHEFGAPVAPMLEGWYQNGDGTATLLVGFFNPNSNQTIELPVGELNHFSPGPEDRGQPTHFPPGRSWGVLTIEVPGDFEGDLTWTLTANNQPASIPLRLRPPYFIEPFKDASNHNEPPIIRFAPNGDPFTGPPVGVAHRVTATVDTPVELRVWTSDVKPEEAPEGLANPFITVKALTVVWHLHRGPAVVELVEPTHEFEDSADQSPTTTATFSVPGEYLQRARRVPATSRGARRDRGGRRRVPVLLDLGDRARDGLPLIAPRLPRAGGGGATDLPSAAGSSGPAAPPTLMGC